MADSGNPTPPGWTTTPTRIARQGHELWRLTRDAHTVVCDLRDLSGSGDGAEVRLFVDGDLSVSHLYVNEPRARYAAGTLKQDHLNAGWTEQTP